MIQVDDTVFCGGEEAPLNLNMLCRLQIEYIVDLSGRDEDTFRRFENSYPSKQRKPL